MSTNLILMLMIPVAIVFLIIGVYIGFLLANKDDNDNRAKVAKMSDHDLFMKRHGLANDKKD